MWGARAGRMTRSLSPLLVVVAVSSACRGTTSASGTGSPSTADGASAAAADGSNDSEGGSIGSNGGSTDSNEGSAGSSAGSDASGDAGSCSALSGAAQSVFTAASMAATADLSCTSDSDCTMGPGAVTCISTCGGPLTTTAGAAVIQKAIDHDNATACATYKAMGCPPPVGLPCVAPIAGVACVQGTCAIFPPAAWTSFAFDEHPPPGGFSTPPVCAPGTTCSLWTVTPDAKVTVVDPQGTHDATLSTADFATVDGIMRSMAFRTGIVSGFPCGNSFSSQDVSFDESRGGRLQGQDVTACIFSGESNDVLTLF